jgi:hypothetical protein
MSPGIKKLALIAVFLVVLIILFAVWGSDHKGPDSSNANPPAIPFVTAYRSCVNSAKLYFRLPSSFDDKWSYMNSGWYDEHSVVIVKFSVKNEFNMQVEGDAYCDIVNGGLEPYLIKMKDGTKILDKAASRPSTADAGVTSENRYVKATREWKATEDRNAGMISKFENTKARQLISASPVECQMLDAKECSTAIWTEIFRGFHKSPGGPYVVLEMQDLKSGKHYFWEYSLSDNGSTSLSDEQIQQRYGNFMLPSSSQSR